MKLHLNKEDFKDLITLTSKDMSILEVNIEKEKTIQNTKNYLNKASIKDK